MFKIIRYTTQFKKDYKSYLNQKSDKSTIDQTIKDLISEKDLDLSFRKHTLKGKLKGHYECHMKPDLLMIWKEDKLANLIIFIRIGSHSELFE